MVTDLLTRSPSCAEAAQRLSAGECLFLVGKPVSFFALLLSSLFRSTDRPFLVVAPDDIQAEQTFQDFAACGVAADLRLLPAPDFFAGQKDALSEEMIGRVKVLTSLAGDAVPTITIASWPALLPHVPAPEEFRRQRIVLKPETALRRETLLDTLIRAGYEERDLVEQPGEFARRGGIVDFFPPGEEFPVRVELLGGSLSSLRKFDTGRQTSFERMDECSFLPLSELLMGVPATASVWDFLANAHTFLINPGDFDEQRFRGTLPRDMRERLLTTGERAEQVSAAHICSEMFAAETGGRPLVHFTAVPAGERFRIKDTFIWNRYPGERIVIFSGNVSQEERLKELLTERGADLSETEFREGTISRGFAVPEIGTTLLSGDEIFARYRTRRAAARRPESVPLEHWEDLRVGDYAVHFNEGIGKFLGMRELDVDGQRQEFILLEYADDDKLYVPVGQIAFLHKYIGEKPPALSNVGRKSWIRVRDAVKKTIRDLASDLYGLYVERKQKKGFAFLPDDRWQREFDESFIYTETPDQQRAWDEVREDMISDRITDRLVCGDSGYGKTEVAMRACFKAVMSGKQAVVLTPTTVLALQHLMTFRERFADFPVRIEMLSRFVGKTRQNALAQELREGTIDIIIGTHRLLGNDISFKKLGLLVIDEEQRFGVAHKEKMQILFRNVDVLTLTATPIPRTLYLSLSGLRDISIIATPPQGRMAIVTHVGPHDDTLVRHAITRELDRKGQVFYLHNTVHDILRVRDRLAKMVPFARIAAAHGQMNPEELSSVMQKFSRGETDVLVATTIVENGLDIPRANTLIVDNAHCYGLADLYQLRGRVGRYKWHAYAYFLLPSRTCLTDEAKNRLSALQELNKPGSGFKVALRDLEIRGAGNVLGNEQHGFIEQIGFHLYCQFWKEATGIMRGMPETPPEEVAFPAAIPAGYLSSPALRFWLYRRIADIKTDDEGEQLLTEIGDRFGPVPDEILTLVTARLEARKKTAVNQVV